MKDKAVLARHHITVAAMADSQEAMMSMSGFDETEIVRVLAGHHIMVAAMADVHGTKGPIFEDDPNFDTPFRLFHGFLNNCSNSSAIVLEMENIMTMIIKESEECAPKLQALIKVVIWLRCISRIDSYLFKVEDAEKLEMKVTFVDCLCVNLQSGEAVCRILVIFNNKN
ncbi:hypothetical protein Tco_0735497 [Tanacetum coccineum]